MEFVDTDSVADSKDSRVNPSLAPDPAAPAPVKAFSRAGWLRQITQLMPWAVWTWLGGVMLLALWRLGGWIQIGRWMRQGVSPLPPQWTAVMHHLIKASGIRRPVRFLASLKVAVPVTAGWLRPVFCPFIIRDGATLP